MKHSIQYLNKEEIERFFGVILEQKDKEKAKRDLAIFKMIYFHGLRCSELVKIRLRDLDFENDKIYIEATKKGKFGNEYLNPVEKVLILDYLKIRKSKTDYLFVSVSGKQMDRKRINGLFVQFSRVANIPVEKQHPHTLRHTLAVNCANAGFQLVEVQAFLRHKSSKTTEIYFQILEEKKRELQKKAFEFL